MDRPDSPPPALSDLDDAALLLDFDGTLVDLAERPEAIHVPSQLSGQLEALHASQAGALALVSGRYLDDIRKHLGQPAIAMAGSHGAELRGADGEALAGSHPDLPPALMGDVDRFCDSHPAVLIERKPHGIGLHYRAAAEGDGTDEAVEAFASDLAERHGLPLKHGKKVIEVLAAPADKGVAVRALMKAGPFMGRKPIFVGDDVTDEDGFSAAADLGGFGILVGPARESAARYRLDSVKDVHAWLGLKVR